MTERARDERTDTHQRNSVDLAARRAAKPSRARPGQPPSQQARGGVGPDGGQSIR